MGQRIFRSDDTDAWLDKLGNAQEGNGIINTNTTFDGAKAGCSGTSGTQSLTIDATSSFVNGDLVVIHQGRGTGVGVYEYNKIVSGAGTTSLILAYDLMNTYIDSGNSQAHITEMRQYGNFDLSGGVTWKNSNWNQNCGGIIPITCTGTATLTGVIDLNGEAGGTDRNDNGQESGYVGGVGKAVTGEHVGGQAQSGEGSTGAPAYQQSANGTGGGGATAASQGDSKAGGAGGGHATAGTTGQSENGATAGAAGGTTGNAGMTVINFGGAGGGAAVDTAGNVGPGGSGGGILILMAHTIIINGNIVSNGGAGGNGFYGGGGGAAGGSVLLKAFNATLGNNLILAAGGATGIGGHGNDDGGAGGIGRIHLDYNNSYSGSTNPTLDVRQDSSIITGKSYISYVF